MLLKPDMFRESVVMDLFTAIQQRYSYRGEYRPEPVSRDHLQEIVQAGILAPSGCNAQTTSFVIVDDPDKVRQIREIVGRPFLATAPAFIACIVDPTPAFRNCSFAAEDCAAAVENMLLAITGLGYASVWLDGVLRTPAIKSGLAALLQLPATREVRVLLPVGRPAAPLGPKEKQPFAKRAWFNVYGGGG